MQQIASVSNDHTKLISALMYGQLQPPGSVSSKGHATNDYRAQTIEAYTGKTTDDGKLPCLVTGREYDSSKIRAGHIFRQAWNADILVSALSQRDLSA